MSLEMVNFKGNHSKIKHHQHIPGQYFHFITPENNRTPLFTGNYREPATDTYVTLFAIW